ncbi:hypothetical protein [Kitasatospora cinereorecta]|uniref:HEAT repeat domain-containing protein n=1 Tax=Kitasatospora cinereorecta TaxID=285560 RepID=A0ABW0V698_9ACTN
MPLLLADRLLAAVDPLPHPLRLREVARTAAALESAELTDLLADLADHGPYGRRLAALAAFAGRHTAHLAERLTDPDRVVRRYAHRAVRTLPVPDAAVERAVLTAPTAVRAELLHAVLGSGRGALAERLVPALRERGSAAEATRLLPLCSAPFVARELPGLAHAVTFSGSLGHRHPDAVLDAAEQLLADLPYGLRTAFWGWHARGLAAAAAHRPVRVLELLERYPVRRLPRPVRDRLADLAAADPARTLRLLHAVGWTRHDPPLRRSALRRLVEARPEGLVEFAGQFHQDREPLLRLLPPGRRTAFFDELATPDAVRLGMYSDLLVLLPMAERQERARAALAADAKQTHLLVMLPVAEARPRLLAEARSSNAWERGSAWADLVRQAELSGEPQALPEALELLARLRNEQDLVRRDALEAVADIAPARLDDSAAVPLTRLTEDALTARDCSADTRAALARLAAAVLGAHADGPDRALIDWAVATLERTAGAELSIPAGRERAVAAALRPALERSAATREAWLLLAVADALGARAARTPGLAALLERVLADGGDTAFERAAAHLLADPATRADRVAGLLDREPSAEALLAVRAVLTRVRTDLLDAVPAVAPGALRRFAAAPPDLTAADRLVPRQVAAAAERLARTVEDPALTPEERAAALRTAAHLPVHGTALLRRYAADSDVLLAEAALTALPWTEHPAEALPVLLAHAGDDRARVGMYAAARAARHTPAEDLAGPLGRIAVDPSAKVTSRKQAVRLLAEHLPPARAAEHLRAAFRAPEQYLDVRVVVVKQVTARLAELPLWDVLDEAAAGGSELRTAVLDGVLPHRLPAAARPRYAALVARLATDPDPLTAAAAMRLLAHWARHAPHAVTDLADRVTALDRTEGWSTAASVLCRIALSDAPHPLGGLAPGSIMARTLATLLAAVATGEESRPGRDHPARRRVVALLGGLWSYDRSAEDRRAVDRTLVGMLAAVPALLPLTVHKSVLAIDPSAPGLGSELARLADLVADRPALAVATAEHLRFNVVNTVDPDHALAAARPLAADGTLAGGLFAATLTAAVGPRTQWPPAWRAVLAVLREHPLPDVRDAAFQLWPDPDQ